MVGFLVGVEFRYDLFGLDTTAMRASLIAGRAGAKILTSQELQVVIPRKDAPLPDAAWLARDGEIAPQPDLATRSITLTPLTVASRHMILRSGRLYSNPSLYGLYQRQIVEKQNYAVDRVWLYGDSSATGRADEPDGLITRAHATLQLRNGWTADDTGGTPLALKTDTRITNRFPRRNTLEEKFHSIGVQGPAGEIRGTRAALA
jgi:hypothetical protein